MKKLFLLSLLFVGALTFGQTKKVNKQKSGEPIKSVIRFNTTMDSLSYIYKKNVVGYYYSEIADDKRLILTYIKNDKIKDSTIIIHKTQLKTK
jgi:hypothetical protein